VRSVPSRSKSLEKPKNKQFHDSGNSRNVDVSETIATVSLAFAEKVKSDLGAHRELNAPVECLR
jgi:hypothetical protein